MRFRSVVVGRCSSGHLEWSVVYHDHSTERIHQGYWSIHMSQDQRQQLRDAQAAFLRREQREAVLS